MVIDVRERSVSNFKGENLVVEDRKSECDSHTTDIIKVSLCFLLNFCGDINYCGFFYLK